MATRIVVNLPHMKSLELCIVGDWFWKYDIGTGTRWFCWKRLYHVDGFSVWIWHWYWIIFLPHVTSYSTEVGAFDIFFWKSSKNCEVMRGSNSQFLDNQQFQDFFPNQLCYLPFLHIWYLYVKKGRRKSINKKGCIYRGVNGRIQIG